MLCTLHYSFIYAYNLIILNHTFYNRTDSLITVINHVIPENAIQSPPKPGEEEKLQKDLDVMIVDEVPFDQWQLLIMTQSMDELGGLKFKGNLIEHEV